MADSSGLGVVVAVVVVVAEKVTVEGAGIEERRSAVESWSEHHYLRGVEYQIKLWYAQVPLMRAF